MAANEKPDWAKNEGKILKKIFGPKKPGRSHNSHISVEYKMPPPWYARYLKRI